jgi:uncharacterized protein
MRADVFFFDIAPENPQMSITRRGFMQGAAGLGAASLALSFDEWARHLGATEADRVRGFGTLRPTRDEATGLELLELPEGFRYISFGWTGDKLSDGSTTPDSHDGMAVIASNGDTVTLCRNHEIDGSGVAFGKAGSAYDKFGKGGCTNLVFNTRTAKLESSWASLSGTVRNCAGGPTPWGTWLSCEETTVENGDKQDSRDEKGLEFEQTHGWVFEVPAQGTSDARPIKGMGRLTHEAISFDTASGLIYMTEDQGRAGFYRFVPNDRRNLQAGGKVQMLKARGTQNLVRGLKAGQTFDVSWVDIENPEVVHADKKRRGDGCFQKGYAQQAAMFSGLEGCWVTQGKVYFTAKSGGDSAAGQVWCYVPAEEKLTLLFESPSGMVLDMPDNITMSRRGGLVICEDGSTAPQQRLQCLTSEGAVVPFAANNVDLRKTPHRGFDRDYRKLEWAGATFSPDGKWLFANLQIPGITFAITGPWQDGLI